MYAYGRINWIQLKILKLKSVVMLDLNDNDKKTYVKTERVYSLNTALKSGANDNPKQLLY